MRATPHAPALIIGLALLAPPAHADVTPIEFARRQLVSSVGSALVVGELDGNPLPELVGASGAGVLVLRNLGGRNFSAPQTISMAGGGFDPHLADVDGDGLLDIVALRSSPAAVVVRQNLGGFTFAAVETYPIPQQPHALATGDLNGDGRADVVVVCADSLTSLLALPGGALASSEVAMEPFSERAAVVLVDLDADGILDLLTSTTDYATMEVEWRRGGGDGSFEGPALINSAPANVPQLVSADLDLDGDPDVLSPRYDAIEWFANDGYGAFVPRPRIPFDGDLQEAPCVAVGDVDGDGTPDLAASIYLSGNAQQNSIVWVCFAPIDSARRHAGRWHVTREPMGIALADLDGDDGLDAATHSQISGDNFYGHGDESDGQNGPCTALLWNAGNGTLLGKLMVPPGGDDQYWPDPRGLVSLRAAAGAPPDLVASDRGRMRLLRNTGRGTFFPASDVGRGQPREAVDLNRDGCDELIVTSNDTTWVFPRHVSGEEFNPPSTILTGLNYVGSGDFNGDGWPDFALEDVAGHLWMRPGDGSGSIGAQTDLVGSLPNPHGPVLIADFNADGRADVTSDEKWVIWSDHPRALSAVLHTLLNDGHGHLSSEATDTLRIEGDGYSPQSGRLASGDVDGDGDRDLVLEIGSSESSSSGWFGSFVNDGAGNFHAPSPGRFAGNPGGEIGCADFNADGLSDLVIHESDGIDFDFHAYEAIGGGAFASLSYRNGANAVARLSIDDFDGDNRPDVALLGFDGQITIQRNVTPFGPTPTLASLVSARSIGLTIELEWFAPGEGVFSAEIERSTGSADWQRIADMNSNGTGHLRFTDSDVEPGARYGYRLRYHDGALERLTSETWVEVPSLALALRAPRPSPVHGAVAFGLTLPTAGEARLEVLDVSGRRVRDQRLSALAAGEHRIALESGPLPPGLYFARLVFGAQRAATRFIVVR